MPIILQVTYADGETEQIRYPAEIWRRSPASVKRLLVTEKNITEIVVDPLLETADVEVENNFYPRRIIPSRIESFKAEQSGRLTSRDLIQDSKTELRADEDEDDDD